MKTNSRLLVTIAVLCVIGFFFTTASSSHRADAQQFADTKPQLADAKPQLADAKPHLADARPRLADARPLASVQAASQPLLRFRALRTAWDGEKRGSPKLARAKIPGGWLVTVTPNVDGRPAQGVTFVADPTHAWDGGSIPQ